MYNKNIIQKGRFVNRDVLVIGIDIGKSTHAAVGTSLESGFTKPYYIKNSRESFEGFERIMEEWKERFDCKDILIGFESTGHYWKPLAYYLKGKGQFLVEVSTNNTKKSKEMMDNSPLKCDRKDSMVIADLVKQGKILSLREIVHTRENLIKERTSILNRVHKIVDVTFPERREVIKKVGNKTSLFLLNEAPFPEDILEKGLEWLKEWMWKKSRGHYKHLDSEVLYASAKETIGIREGREGSLYELNSLLPRLEELNKGIERIEDRIEEMLEDIEEAKYLLSINGIGLVTVAAVIAESDGLSNYDSMKSVIKVAGLNLYEVSSGKHKGEKRITKRGRSLMRQKLYFAALQQAREGMPFYSFYKRLTDNGVKKTKALIAVATKLLKIMFALVRDEREFERDYKRARKVRAVA
ncbi:IS110 family transposase [candidate division WOR-3 bacterium]|nr:IS110 family transposase [candidate division WOR-3 bacterium]